MAAAIDAKKIEALSALQREDVEFFKELNDLTEKVQIVLALSDQPLLNNNDAIIASHIINFFVENRKKFPESPIFADQISDARMEAIFKRYPFAFVSYKRFAFEDQRWLTFKRLQEFERDIIREKEAESEKKRRKISSANSSQRTQVQRLLLQLARRVLRTLLSRGTLARILCREETIYQGPQQQRRSILLQRR